MAGGASWILSASTGGVRTVRADVISNQTALREATSRPRTAVSCRKLVVLAFIRSTSQPPMSPGSERGMPRWLVVKRLPCPSVQPVGLPASIAGLPESKGIVCVGPPLYPNVAELGVGVVQIARAVEFACVIAAEVVAVELTSQVLALDIPSGYGSQERGAKEVRMAVLYAFSSRLTCSSDFINLAVSP